jgi:hypothetical protein
MDKFDFESWHKKVFGYSPSNTSEKSGLYYREISMMLDSIHDYYTQGLTKDLDNMCEEYLSRKNKL